MIWICQWFEVFFKWSSVIQALSYIWKCLCLGDGRVKIPFTIAVCDTRDLAFSLVRQDAWQIRSQDWNGWLFSPSHLTWKHPSTAAPSLRCHRCYPNAASCVWTLMLRDDMSEVTSPLAVLLIFLIEAFILVDVSWVSWLKITCEVWWMTIEAACIPIICYMSVFRLNAESKAT